MQRRSLNKVSTRVLVASLWCVFLSGAILAADQTTAIVKVDCTKGKGINKALEDNKNARSLIVEIEGMCNENVVVTRDRVTLRGVNPLTDGIHAETNVGQMDASLWVRGAHEVTIENLKLTGGFAGLLATEASTVDLRMFNCRSEGNSAYGVLLQAALLEAEDTVLTENGSFNAGVFGASRFACVRCTLSNPLGNGALGTNRNNTVAAGGSTVILFASTLTSGGIQLTNSVVQGFDSTIDALAPNASVTGGQSVVSLTRVQIGGPMRFNQSTNAVLQGVTQFRSETMNIVDENSFVRIVDAPPATGGPPIIPSTILSFRLQNFSNGSLSQTSQITGNLSCGQGGNAFCTNPANVSGTSNCALCPKP